jgi:uncharacterized protein
MFEALPRRVGAASLGVILAWAAVPAAADVTITGILDGPLSGGAPKVIELYVSGTEDLGFYELERSANGRAFGNATPLAGTYTDAFVYLVGTAGNGRADFEALFGAAGDFANVALVSGNVAGNGDDGFRLVEASGGPVIDQVWTEDTNDVYRDSYLYRNDGTGPDGGWVAANWTFPGNDVLDDLSAAQIAAAVPFGTFVAGAASAGPVIATSVPANNAADVDPAIGTLALTFSEPLAATTDTSAWSLQCPSDGAELAGTPVVDLAAGTATLPLDDLPAGTSCQLTLPAGSVTGATSGQANSAALTVAFSTAQQFAGCGDAGATPIWQIQGDGAVSPLVGQVQDIEGVVVGAYQGTDGSGLSGFFVQEEDTDADGDPATSDGIFVFDNAGVAPLLAVGDIVRVTGTVAEFARSGDTSGSLTQLNKVQAVTVCTGLTGTATPAVVELPLASDPTTDLEPVEGMAVTLLATDGELTLAEYFNLDRFGEIRVAAGGRPEQFTMANQPDPAGFAAHQAELARRTLMIDDGRSGQNRDPLAFGRGGLPIDVTSAPPNLLRGGDTVARIDGVMHYDFGVYRMQPVLAPSFVAGNERPAAPPAIAGALKVASYNVLNYFQQLDDGTAKCGPPGFQQTCRGADQGPVDSLGRNERDRQEQKLIPALLALDADIIGLIEIENDFGAGGTSSAQNLADLMNAQNALDAITDCAHYSAVDPGDWVGTDVIAVGYLYCADTVEVAPGSTPAMLDDSGLADLGLADLAPLFNGDNTSRVPLAVSFRELASGEVLTIAVNHFKSKGDSGLARTTTCRDTPALDPNCDQADGAGFWNGRRADTATALAAWLATGPTGNADPDLLIIGDLNAYAKEEPIARLEALGYENLSARIGGYSFLFDAQLGSLDYALASPSLAAKVAGIAEWHINADEPDALDYDISFNSEFWYREDAFRTSDHDPLLVGIDLLAIPEAIPGDLNGDGRVDIADFQVFRAALGSRTGQARFNADADYDGDGVVSYRDYRIWYGHWQAAVRG